MLPLVPLPDRPGDFDHALLTEQTFILRISFLRSMYHQAAYINCFHVDLHYQLRILVPSTNGAATPLQ